MEFFGLVNNLIANVPKRSQDIIRKRFGLMEDKGQTLEQIGEAYGITRERVRQIVADVLKNIAARSDSLDYKKLEDKLVFTIEQNNGIIKEDDIVRKFNLDGAREANAIRFFAQCSKRIVSVFEKGVIEKSWALSRDILADIMKTSQEAEKLLLKAKKPLTGEEISRELANSSGFSREKLLSFLTVLRKIQKNKFGKWGMAFWNEINPKGTREKIFLILKETGAPLHFTEIAKLIDKYGLGKRNAHPQTVHNELIKDQRFVLIGRGTYAIGDWGYSEGTIKEVLKDILEKSEKPLPKEEILEKVFKIRKVKKTTVMINLNNSKIFEKHNNLYSVKK